MKVRVYGYKIDPALFPKAMDKLMIYEHLAVNAGGSHSAYRYGAHKVRVPVNGGHEEWWGGMVLKVRDSKAFLKLVEKGGKSILTTEDLGAGEKLAEVNFFLANPKTGNGLYAHHSHSASLMNFDWLCRKLFNKVRREKYRVARAAALTPKEKDALKKAYTGEHRIGLICRESNLKDLVRSLTKVKSFEYSMSTVTTSERFLRPVSARAASEKIKFIFPPDADVDALADALDETLDGEGVEDLKVTGVDNHKQTREFKKDGNPFVFEEYEYDELVKGLRLDLNNWGESIINSVVIARLKAVAYRPQVLLLMNKA